MANEVCFRTLHRDRSWTLEAYRAEGGYEILKKILEEQTPQDEIIDKLLAVTPTKEDELTTNARFQKIFAS